MLILDYLASIGSLSSPDSRTNSIKSLEFKYLGLYFTAQWCMSCIKGCPRLQQIMNRIEQKKPGTFKLITIRLDTGSSKLGYNFWRFSTLPQNKAHYLSQYFKVAFLPNIVILNKNGNIVTYNGYQDLLQYQQNVLQKWDKQSR